MVIGRGRRREHPQPTLCTTTTLVNMITDFAFMEGYQLPPTKSVVRNVSSKKNHTYNRKSVVYKRFSVSICGGAMRSHRK
jgi:hypothetical protein